MGKGIKRKIDVVSGSSARITDTVIITELNQNEIQLARIGTEIPLLNANSISDGDYVEFTLIFDNNSQMIVGDKPQRDATVKSSVYNNQSISNITVNRNEVVLIINKSQVGEIEVNGGIIVSDDSIIEKIKDGNTPSDMTILLHNTQVTKDIKINGGATVIFVAHSSTFNENIKFSQNNPKILCLSDCNVNKLTVK
ncbi:MAG: hypothetical protein AB1304_07700 [Bacteroidota bacterium]